MALDIIDKYGEDDATKDLVLNEMPEPIEIVNFVTFMARGLADHGTGGAFEFNSRSFVH